jgi:hypothetical protein
MRIKPPSTLSRVPASSKIRGRLDRTAAGLQQIVTLLTDGRPVVQ